MKASMVRRKGRTFVLADTDEFAPVVAEPGFQTAYVQIGNVRITNSGLGSRVIQRRSAQQRPQLEEASESQSEESDSDSQGSADEDADEEAVKDYLQNLAAQEQDEDEKRDNEDGKGVQVC